MDQPLHMIFKDLASRYSRDEVIHDTLWREIEESYSMPGRYYHNLSHLEHMIEKAFQHRDKIGDFDVLLFSIFYHDIAYDPKRNDNERKSAEIAKRRMKEIGVPAERIEKCYRQILATRHHDLSSDNDTRFLLDIDLAILGEEPVKYEEYVQKVRREYAFYPKAVLNKGRMAILKNLLAKDRIFQTQPLYELYEKQARQNLMGELEKLKS